MCHGVVTEKKQQSASGTCVIEEEYSTTNKLLYSLIYLSVKTITPGIYHYQCLSKEGTVLTNEIVACKYCYNYRIIAIYMHYIVY